MKPLVLSLVAIPMLLGGCVQHMSYDYFAPQGPGKVMSTVTGEVGPGPAELVLVEQETVNLTFSARPKTEDSAEFDLEVVVVEKADHTPFAFVEAYLKKSLFLEVTGVRYKPISVRLAGNGFFRDGFGEASIGFTALPKGLESFTLELQLKNGGSTSIIFVKKHADYWQAVRQLM